MNPLQSYLQVVAPFARPYLSVVGAYARFLQKATRDEPVKLPEKGPLDSWEEKAGYVPLVEALAPEQAETEKRPKRAAASRAAAARSVRGWETRRSNAEKAKKAARRKARKGVH